MIPGLPMALHTVLNQASDEDVINMLLFFEKTLGETINEIQTLVIERNEQCLTGETLNSEGMIVPL